MNEEHQRILINADRSLSPQEWEKVADKILASYETSEYYIYLQVYDNIKGYRLAQLLFTRKKASTGAKVTAAKPIAVKGPRRGPPRR